jgi:hypothetical protein
VPAAMLRACAFPGGCGELVESGRCKTHRLEVERQRGSAAARGYDAHWSGFRKRFIARLIAADIAPACGASLPDGPNTRAFSQCAQEGRLTVDALHLDHEPPLTEAERGRRAAVEDPRRVGFLCPSCHSRKTRNEQADA